MVEVFSCAYSPDPVRRIKRAAKNDVEMIFFNFSKGYVLFEANDIIHVLKAFHNYLSELLFATGKERALGCLLLI